jgi:uncharacterized protein YutE (UPF0331/DUF86 family)
MVDSTILLRKLAALAEHVARLRRRLPADSAALVGDVDRQDALAMSFLVAVQQALDIAAHIAADEGYGVAPSYSGAFRLLAERGVLDLSDAEHLAKAALLRNRIAHGYTSVDFNRLWHEIPTAIQAFDAFAQRIATRFGVRS